MKSIERSARANCTAATLRNCGHAQLLLHACGHTCLVSAYMLISHCVNPCTNSKTVHFCSASLSIVLLAEILMAKVTNLKRLPYSATGCYIVIDLDDVLFSDLKADDLGTWIANGTKSTYFTIIPQSVINPLNVWEA